MCQLRKATIEDIEQIYDLICQLESTVIDKASFLITYNENLLNPLVSYFVYEMENQVVAFASLHIQKLLHHSAKIGEIQEIVVKNDLRGKGIGENIFQQIKAYCQKNGCIQLEVCCNQTRLASHRFYLAQQMTNSHYKFCLNLI